METIDATITHSEGSLEINVYGELRCDTEELIKFKLGTNHADLTAAIKELNLCLFERLRDKIITALKIQNMPEAGDL